MKLADLEQAGAFVSAEPVAREIKWKMHGTDYTATVFIRQLSVGEQERMYQRFAKDDQEGGEKRYKATTIASLVGFGEKGDERLTIEKADSLHPMLADALMEAIQEVNGQFVKN